MNSYLVLELSSYRDVNFSGSLDTLDHNLRGTNPQTGIYCESFRDSTLDPRDAVIWSSQTPITRGMKLTIVRGSRYAAAYGRKRPGPE